MLFRRSLGRICVLSTSSSLSSPMAISKRSKSEIVEPHAPTGSMSGTTSDAAAAVGGTPSAHESSDSLGSVSPDVIVGRDVPDPESTTPHLADDVVPLEAEASSSPPLDQPNAESPPNIPSIAKGSEAGGGGAGGGSVSETVDEKPKQTILERLTEKAALSPAKDFEHLERQCRVLRTHLSSTSDPGFLELALTLLSARYDFLDDSEAGAAAVEAVAMSDPPPSSSPPADIGPVSTDVKEEPETATGDSSTSIGSSTSTGGGGVVEGESNRLEPVSDVKKGRAFDTKTAVDFLSLITYFATVPVPKKKKKTSGTTSNTDKKGLAQTPQTTTADSKPEQGSEEERTSEEGELNGDASASLDLLEHEVMAKKLAEKQNTLLTSPVFEKVIQYLFSNASNVANKLHTVPLMASLALLYPVSISSQDEEVRGKGKTLVDFAWAVAVTASERHIWRELTPRVLAGGLEALATLSNIEQSNGTDVATTAAANAMPPPSPEQAARVVAVLEDAMYALLHDQGDVPIDRPAPARVRLFEATHILKAVLQLLQVEIHGSGVSQTIGRLFSESPTTEGTADVGNTSASPFSMRDDALVVTRRVSVWLDTLEYNKATSLLKGAFRRDNVTDFELTVLTWLHAFPISPPKMDQLSSTAASDPTPSTSSNSTNTQQPQTDGTGTPSPGTDKVPSAEERSAEVEMKKVHHLVFPQRIGVALVERLKRDVDSLSRIQVMDALRIYHAVKLESACGILLGRLQGMVMKLPTDVLLSVLEEFTAVMPLFDPEPTMTKSFGISVSKLADAATKAVGRFKDLSPEQLIRIYQLFKPGQIAFKELAPECRRLVRSLPPQSAERIVELGFHHLVAHGCWWAHAKEDTVLKSILRRYTLHLNPPPPPPAESPTTNQVEGSNAVPAAPTSVDSIEPPTITASSSTSSMQSTRASTTSSTTIKPTPIDADLLTPVGRLRLYCMGIQPPNFESLFSLQEIGCQKFLDEHLLSAGEDGVTLATCLVIKLWGDLAHELRVAQHSSSATTSSPSGSSSLPKSSSPAKEEDRQSLLAATSVTSWLLRRYMDSGVPRTITAVEKHLLLPTLFSLDHTIVLFSLWKLSTECPEGDLFCDEESRCLHAEFLTALRVAALTVLGPHLDSTTIAELDMQQLIWMVVSAQAKRLATTVTPSLAAVVLLTLYSSCRVRLLEASVAVPKMFVLTSDEIRRLVWCAGEAQKTRRVFLPLSIALHRLDCASVFSQQLSTMARFAGRFSRKHTTATLVVSMLNPGTSPLASQASHLFVEAYHWELEPAENIELACLAIGVAGKSCRAQAIVVGSRIRTLVSEGKIVRTSAHGHRLLGAALFMLSRVGVSMGVLFNHLVSLAMEMHQPEPSGDSGVDTRTTTPASGAPADEEGRPPSAPSIPSRSLILMVSAISQGDNNTMFHAVLRRYLLSHVFVADVDGGGGGGGEKEHPSMQMTVEDMMLLLPPLSVAFCGDGELWTAVGERLKCILSAYEAEEDLGTVSQLSQVAYCAFSDACCRKVAPKEILLSAPLPPPPTEEELQAINNAAANIVPPPDQAAHLGGDEQIDDGGMVGEEEGRSNASSVTEVEEEGLVPPPTEGDDLTSIQTDDDLAGSL